MALPRSQIERDNIKMQIDSHAARSARRLKASHVLMIAFWEEDGQVYMQDGGTCPCDVVEVYNRLLAAYTMLEEPGGKDVAAS